MKKLIPAALLCAALVFLTACSLQPAETSPAPSAPPPEGQVIAEPVPHSVNLADTGFYENLRALDYVTLPADLLSIPYDAEKCAVSEEELQASLDEMLATHAFEVQLTDRAVQIGDLVNIDFIGRVDGVEFEGGNSQGQGVQVTAGSTQFIDDFLTQIIGHMPGETFDVTVTFPTPYLNNQDLSGKDAVFETTINYVYGTENPTLTDAFVAENYPGYASAQAMREDVRQDMLDARRRGYALEYVMTNSTFKEFPAFLMDGQQEILLAEMKQTAASYGVQLADLLKAYDIADEAALLEQYAAQLQDSLQQFVTLQAVAEQQGISITRQDVEAYLTELVGGGTFEQYAAQLGEGYLFRAALDAAVLDLLTAPFPG